MTDPASARVGVAVPAAGSGQRMGGARKPFLDLMGEPLLVHALRPFLADERVVSVAVALPSDFAVDPPGWLVDLDPRVVVVEGGASRGASVTAALASLPDDVDVIAVHDAARPLVRPEVVRSCIELAVKGVGAVAGSRATDTMKVVDDRGRIIGTPDRATLRHAHTPQVFPAELLRRAYGQDRTGSATDDAALVEKVGGEVVIVDDGGTNLKVTTPKDLAVAEALLRREQVHS